MSRPRSPVITFLSDYGLSDDFVGLCHAVIAGIAPNARVIDLTHGVPRHDVLAGAVLLRGELRYLPVGVHLAVVDPDVGAERRAVALRLADKRLLVGPDNGLLSLAAELGGGIVEAVDIGSSPYRLQPVAATFHGRDIFAPVAARLAAGVALAETGTPCAPAELVTLSLPPAEIAGGKLVARVMYIDRFGNVQLNISHEEILAAGLKLGEEMRLHTGSGWAHSCHYARTFADVREQELLAYEDAYQQLALAVNHGDAAALLGVQVRDEVRIELA